MKTTLHDGHSHYTGSLSISYLRHRIDEVRQTTQYPFEVEDLIPEYGDDWKANFDSFFESYKKIQEITKSVDPKEQVRLYESGGYDILYSYHKEGVNSFDLRVGPRIDLVETVKRLKAMLSGFIRAERELGIGEVGRFILTLIHDKTGKFFNVNEASLKELLDFLDTDNISSRVIGFDFSGPEDNLDTDQLFRLLDILVEYNRSAQSKSKKTYLITVHAGEYVDSSNALDRLSFIRKLINYPIDRLSHGTILWLKSDLVDSTQKDLINIIQADLLSKMARKRVILEICPTANLYLSPLPNVKDIPFAYFDKIGLHYSINTDNKTLFSTDLKKEIASADQLDR